MCSNCAKDGAIVKEYPLNIEVLVGQIHSMKTTVSDSLTHMLPVFVGADAQTVVVADPGSAKPIGYIVNTSGAALIGEAGLKVDVLIIPQLPTAGIA